MRRSRGYVPEPLAVAGERLWAVDPLPTGPKDLFASDVVLGELAEGVAKRVLPAEIRLSIRQVAVHRSEDAADQPKPTSGI